MKKLMIAPLAGVSNIPFRLACLRYGIKYQYTEMVMAKSLFYANSQSHYMLERAEGERWLGAQLIGEEPEYMARGAKLVDDKGFDALDLNFGCPVKKVVRKGQGAAMLKDLKQLEAVVRAVTRAVKIPVSAKIRTGWSASCDSVLDIVRMAKDYGLSHLTVHGRSWKSMYTAPVDLDMIRRVKEHAGDGLEVIGNGGIFSVADAKNMVEKTGVDGVMLARGVMGRPWLAGQILAAFENRAAPPEATAQSIVDDYRFHVEKVLEYLPEHEKLGYLKKLSTWYLWGFAGNKYIRVRMYESRSVSQYMEIFKNDVLDAGLELSQGARLFCPAQ